MAGGFDSLGLMPEILRAVDETLDWNLPTDIQDEAIPLILGGGDVMAAAETGSGKTGAFCLPMIQCVHERLREIAENDTDAKISSSENGTIGYSIVDIRMSENDKDNMILISTDGLTATGQAEKQWTGARATHGTKAGKYYYECTILEDSYGGKGICRVGFSTIAAHHELGRDAYGFGYGGTGMKSFKNGFDKYGETYATGDIIGCFLDIETNTISYSKNGVDLGVAFNMPDTIQGTVLFPAICLKGAKVSLNFGGASFAKLSSESSEFSGFTGSGVNSADIICSSSKEAFVVQGKRLPLAIILEPARDLAEQVYTAVKDMTKYISEPELKSVLLIGGDDNKKMSKALKGGVDIVVGTIGKVSDMFKSGALSLSQIKFFILDEADRMIDEPANLNTILQLYAACPSGGLGENRLQVCFFSATLHSPEIKNLAEKVCVNPTWIDLKGFESVPETVHHVVFKVDPVRDLHLIENSPKTSAVLDEIHTAKDANDPESEKSRKIKELKQQILLGIIDKFEMSQCIIFCRTNVDCNQLETFLCNHGGGSKFKGRVESGKEHKYSCCVLAGMRSMNERRSALEAFKEGEVRFLICTDVAARGIDIKNLPYVINMTLPDEAENYIHRIGRVGRAERMGLAISIVAGQDIKEKVWFHTCKDRGKNCQNRELTEKGGCTIWNDEPKMLKSIEERLHQQIPELNPSTYELPKEIAELNIEYGEEVAQVGGRANLHLELLGPTVVELGGMEVEAQNLFHILQGQFGRFDA